MTKLFLNPALDEQDTDKILEQLQTTLYALNDLHLTLKHAHWNVTGPNFIAVHEMIDPHIDEIRDAADNIGERIAALGGDVDGTTAGAAKGSPFGDYPVKGRASTTEHLKALDKLYVKLDLGLRDAIDKVDPLDVISSNKLQDVLEPVEQFHWFVRSHLV
jgi:starvation-inducible DNA-binding protein